MLEEAEDAEEKHLYATIIEENNKLLLQLISDILELVKIEAGTFDIIPEQVDAQQLCNELLQSMQVRATEQVEILLAPELPELTFTSDKNRLYQVLLNFVTNALKFTSEAVLLLITESTEMKSDSRFKIREWASNRKSRKLSLPDS